MLYAIVALLVIILDQWTKFWVAGHITFETGSRELIPGLIKLVNIHNDGAALGFLSGKNAGMLFIVLCAVFTIFVIIALATKLVKAPIARWSLVFIMAGGLSNCIDRLLSGYVQDMFMPTFMDNLPIFNVADIFITVFCLVFVLFVLFGGRGGDEEDYDDEDEDEYDEDEREDEEDDLPPARRPSRYDRAARAGRRPEKQRAMKWSRGDEDDYDDEEEDEEPEEKPLRRSQRTEKPAPKKSRTSRRDRQAELDEKYARFKAERAAREQQWSAEVPEEAPVIDPADPFAEWDRPRRRAETPAAPAPASAESRPAPVEDWAAPAAEDFSPAAPAPAPKKAESEEFSLEDILAEFK